MGEYRKIDNLLRPRPVELGNVPGVIAIAVEDNRQAALRKRHRHPQPLDTSVANDHGQRALVCLDDQGPRRPQAAMQLVEQGHADLDEPITRASSPVLPTPPGPGGLRCRGQTDPPSGETADHAPPSPHPHVGLRLRTSGMPDIRPLHDREQRSASHRLQGGIRSTSRLPPIPASAGNMASASTGSASSSKPPAASGGWRSISRRPSVRPAGHDPILAFIIGPRNDRNASPRVHQRHPARQRAGADRSRDPRTGAGILHGWRRALWHGRRLRNIHPDDAERGPLARRRSRC